VTVTEIASMDHFTGTRCLSSSSQFTTMLMRLGKLAAGVLPAA
jgi:hypothetical protein